MEPVSKPVGMCCWCEKVKEIKYFATSPTGSRVGFCKACGDLFDFDKLIGGKE